LNFKEAGVQIDITPLGIIYIYLLESFCKRLAMSIKHAAKRHVTETNERRRHVIFANLIR